MIFGSRDLTATAHFSAWASASRTVPLVPLTWYLGAWLVLLSPSRWLLRTISLVYAIQFARHPPKFSGIRFTAVKVADAPVLHAEIDMQPLLHCTQERWWVTINLGPARPELGPSPVTVQDVDAETHLQVHPSLRLVCSDQPEGRVLSCVDPSAPQTISAVCIRRTCISVQGPALRAVPVSLCLHESCGVGSCSPQRAGCTHPRQLAYTSTVSGSVVRPCISLGRNTPRADLQACCGSHGCLHHRMGCHVQRTSSIGDVDGPPAALAYQLPRVVSGEPCLERYAVQGQGGQGAGPACGFVLAHSDLVPGTNAPRDTPGHAKSGSCFPFCSKGWSKGCLPPTLKSMSLRLLLTMTLWKGSR